MTARNENYNEIDSIVDNLGGIISFKNPFKYNKEIPIYAVIRIAEGNEHIRLVAVEKDFTNWDIDDYFSDEQLELLKDVVVATNNARKYKLI